MTGFSDLFQWGKSAPVERKVADLIAGTVESDPFEARVRGGSVPEGRFETGTSYFGVRLSGLHMVDARHFATQVLPLCICLAEFDYGGERRTAPFSVGPKTIQQRLADAGIKETDKAKPAWIELKDLTVVKPTPVNDGNLSLYAGLFSVPGNDLVKNLLDVVGTVGAAVGATELTPGLKVAETVYNSFGSLLGLRDVSQVVAALIGNALTDKGSGYLLIANTSPQGTDMQQMRVVNGRLCWPNAGPKKGAPVYEFDHALLALERFGTVIAKDGLAPLLFEKNWSSTREAIGGGNKEAASAAFDKLQGAIFASNNLIEDDRVALLGGYQKRYQQLAELRWPAARDASKGGGQRGGAGDSLHNRVLSAANSSDGELGNDLATIAEVLGRPAHESDARDADIQVVVDAATAVRAGLGRQSQPGEARGQLATALLRATTGFEPR
jgi:hypothetical protein